MTGNWRGFRSETGKDHFGWNGDPDALFGFSMAAGSPSTSRDRRSRWRGTMCRRGHPNLERGRHPSKRRILRKGNFRAADSSPFRCNPASQHAGTSCIRNRRPDGTSRRTSLPARRGVLPSVTSWGSEMMTPLGLRLSISPREPSQGRISQCTSALDPAGDEQVELGPQSRMTMLSKKPILPNQWGV